MQMVFMGFFEKKSKYIIGKIFRIKLIKRYSLFLSAFLFLASCTKENEEFYPIINSPKVDFKIDNHRKVWLHASNTISKCHRLSELYSGVEVDIYFDTLRNQTIVGHWPEETSDTSLVRLIEHIKHPFDRYFWLDLKTPELTDKQINTLARELDSVCTRHNLRNRLIVESWNYTLLQEIKKHGFLVSFAIDKPVGQTENEFYETVSSDLKKGDVGIISYHARHWNTVNRCFPNFKHMIFGGDKANSSFYITKENVISYLVDDDS